MERDIVFSGVHIGEHSIDPANFINEPRKLFGAEFSGNTHKSNFGVKFTHSALDKNAVYHGTKNFIVDPLYSAGVFS